MVKYYYYDLVDSGLRYEGLCFRDHSSNLFFVGHNDQDNSLVTIYSKSNYVYINRDISSNHYMSFLSEFRTNVLTGQRSIKSLHMSYFGNYSDRVIDNNLSKFRDNIEKYIINR